MIEFAEVTKKFGDYEAVKSLDMHIKNGSITVIIGPSGCGKTTTLKMVNRLIEADSGTIRIDNRSIFSYNPVLLRRSIGYVIQETGLFPHYNVFENVAVVPRLLKWKENRIRDRVDELLDMVTLDPGYVEKYPLQLSGGERQRVGLARALAVDPDILLMDEPFGAIDPINRITLQDVFLDIQEKLGKTIVFVTHDINEAIKLGDAIAIMNEGSLVQYDAPAEILSNPENEFVESMLGHDRNLKALSLKKTREMISDRGYVTVKEDTPAAEVEDKLTHEKSAIAFVVNDAGKLAGRYSLEKKKDGTAKLLREISPIAVERNSNLNEALSKMLESGEKVLPVINKSKNFLGVVSISSLFTELGKDQDGA